MRIDVIHKVRITFADDSARVYCGDCDVDLPLNSFTVEAAATGLALDVAGLRETLIPLESYESAGAGVKRCTHPSALKQAEEDLGEIELLVTPRDPNAEVIPKMTEEEKQVNRSSFDMFLAMREQTRPPEGVTKSS